jgi:hypothetical protein
MERPLRMSNDDRLSDRHGRRADTRVHAFCSSLLHAATLQLGASAPAATQPAGSPPPAAPVARIQAPLSHRSPSRATLRWPGVGAAVPDMRQIMITRWLIGVHARDRAVKNLRSRRMPSTFTGMRKRKPGRAARVTAYDNFLFHLVEMEAAIERGGIGWTAETADSARRRLSNVLADMTAIVVRLRPPVPL